MGVIPQPYPLWLAEIGTEDIHAGRVVGWWVAETEVDQTPLGTATPIVAFTTSDGLIVATRTPSGAMVFLGDTRHGALAAARRIAHPTTAPPADSVDGDDDARPPDARPRTSVLRRPSLYDETDAATADQPPGLVTRRTTGH